MGCLRRIEGLRLVLNAPTEYLRHFLGCGATAFLWSGFPQEWRSNSLLPRWHTSAARLRVHKLIPVVTLGERVVGVSPLAPLRVSALA